MSKGGLIGLGGCPGGLGAASPATGPATWNLKPFLSTDGGERAQTPTLRRATVALPSKKGHEIVLFLCADIEFGWKILYAIFIIIFLTSGMLAKFLS